MHLLDSGVPALENAIIPNRNTESASRESSASRGHDPSWFGWLKGLLPGQNRNSNSSNASSQAKFQNIWISREAGSGSDLIANQVANRLGWTIYNEEIIDIISRRMQVSPELVKTLDELAPGMIQDWILPLREHHYAPQETYLEHLEHLIQEVGKLGNAVIVGRGAGFVLPHDRTLRIRLVAPISNRAARLADRMGVSHRTAKRAVKDLDRRRRQFDWALYRRESNDPHNYHMTLDTTALGIPMCADLITLAILRGLPSGQTLSGQRVVNVNARGADQPDVVVIDPRKNDD